VVGEFWRSVTGSLADRWAAVGVPALVFWVGAVLACAAGGQVDLLLTSVTSLEGRSTVVQVMVLLSALLVVAASAVVVNRLITPTLRRLEGYQWPTWALARWNVMTGAVQRQYDLDMDAWQPLQDRLAGGSTLSGEQHQAYARLDARLHRCPTAREEMMPTRIGNILKAAERRPRDKYGLEGVIVWPRLWLAMPDASRKELGAARSSLDSAVAAVVWGLLFAVLVPAVLLAAGVAGFGRLAPFAAATGAAAVGVLVALAAVRWWVPARAEVFGDLLDSAFDLHRAALYQQLRWPLPEHPAHEAGQHGTGAALTEYLWRGSDSSEPHFTSTP
jgi:hypothetical protein